MSVQSLWELPGSYLAPCSDSRSATQNLDASIHPGGDAPTCGSRSGSTARGAEGPSNQPASSHSRRPSPAQTRRWGVWTGHTASYARAASTLGLSTLRVRHFTQTLNLHTFLDTLAFPPLPCGPGVQTCRCTCLSTTGGAVTPRRGQGRPRGSVHAAPEPLRNHLTQAAIHDPLFAGTSGC